MARHQDDLAKLSSNSTHRTVAGATHQSLIDNRDDAAESIRAIRDVVTAVRTDHGDARTPAGEAPQR